MIVISGREFNSRIKLVQKNIVHFSANLVVLIFIYIILE